MAENKAAFVINGNFATNDRGFLASNGQVLTVQLEDNADGLTTSVVFQVFHPAIPGAPLASKGAPLLTWDQSGTSIASIAHPANVLDGVTLTLPATGAHSYLIRATVRRNVEDPRSQIFIFERLVCIPTPTTPPVRKLIPYEVDQFGRRGPSDVQNDIAEALLSSGNAVHFEAASPDDSFGLDGTVWWDTANSRVYQKQGGTYVLQAVLGSGGGGGSDAHYVHTQNVPSATWVINHNLGKVPDLTIVDSSGEECRGNVDYGDPISLVQTIVRFSAAFAGKAYCN